MGSSSEDIGRELGNRATRLVRGEPDAFKPGGRYLDEHYSKTETRRALKIIDANRPAQADPMRPEVWKRSLSLRGRMEFATRDLGAIERSPGGLLAMSTDQALAICILTWILADSETDSFQPVLCRFQLIPYDPWTEAEGLRFQGKHGVVEGILGSTSWVRVASAAYEKAVAVLGLEDAPSQVKAIRDLRDSMIKRGRDDSRRSDAFLRDMQGVVQAVRDLHGDESIEKIAELVAAQRQRGQPADPTAAPPQPRRKGGADFESGARLWQMVSELDKGAAVPGTDIYKGLGMSAQFLRRHRNVKDGVQFPERLTPVEGPLGPRRTYYSRESILSWLAAYFGASIEQMEKRVHKALSEGQAE